MNNGDEVNHADYHGDDLGDHDVDLDDDDQAGVCFAVAVCCNCEQMSRALRVS